MWLPKVEPQCHHEDAYSHQNQQTGAYFWFCRVCCPDGKRFTPTPKPYEVPEARVLHDAQLVFCTACGCHYLDVCPKSHP